MNSEEFLDFARSVLQLPPSNTSRPNTNESKLKIKCSCGSYILTTSMANHLKSRRHIRNNQTKDFSSSGLNVTFD